MPGRFVCVFFCIAIGTCVSSAFFINEVVTRKSIRRSGWNRHFPMVAESNFVDDNDDDIVGLSNRKAFLQKVLISTGVTSFGSSFIASPNIALADDDGKTTLFSRTGKGFSYTFSPPYGFTEGNKPLKTHFDEINFSKEGIRGYQYGVTIDPVRLKTLSQFGTPEEVAAKIVTAEVNRDGIFEVTLYRDPVEDTDTGAYEIDYISDGKRGKKYFMTRTAVKDGMLYVLTAQVKEENFKEKEAEMITTVKTFKPGQ